MTLIAPGAGRRRTAYENGLPYTVPTVAPFNAPMPNETPTPDGTGIVIHPSVIDFHKVPGVAGDWHGWRYWQANTPMADLSQENPIILVSQDGFHWYEPRPGLNPLYRPPAAGTYNSDTDLHYDPDNDRLVLIYRTGLDECWVASSPDGATWPPAASFAFASTGTTPSTGEITHGLSPVLVHMGPSFWRVFLFYNGGGNAGVSYRDASDPLGTWSAPTVVPWSSIRPWHGHIIKDGGVLRMVTSGQFGRLYCAASVDGGASWLEDETDTRPLYIGAGAGAAWETGTFYRPAVQPWDATTYQLWYTCESVGGSWRMAYTRIPISLFPA